MKLPAYSPRFDWLLQLIVIPLHIGLLNWALIGDSYWHNLTTFGLATGITVVVAFFNWLVNNAIALRFQKKYPLPDQYAIRTLSMASVCATSSCLHSTVIFGLYSLIKLPGFSPDLFRLGLGLLSTMIVVVMVIATYESIQNFGNWQQSRREVDTLSKAQLQAQLDALRQQVNPHFLFNSLNSLIALIGEDPRQAETFAEELSTVYRYLLRSNECPLIPLASELEFIQSYYHLLKTRHGDSLTLTVDVLPEAQARQLPPLTLQLLIENAVKHNTILPQQPLMIMVKTDDRHRLIVSNNLQRKPNRGLSNGIGLSNIMTTYRMLGQESPVIEDDGNEFRVIIPLVGN